MRNIRTLMSLSIGLLLLAGGAPEFGQNPTPSAKVAIESTSIAAGVGVSWGNGVLEFQGKKYSFSVDGLSLIDLGITKASEVGDVYNLTNPSQLAGTYVAAEIGFALAGGM